jgi:hypothetical protein
MYSIEIILKKKVEMGRGLYASSGFICAVLNPVVNKWFPQNAGNLLTREQLV